MPANGSDCAGIWCTGAGDPVSPRRCAPQTGGMMIAHKSFGPHGKDMTHIEPSLEGCSRWGKSENPFRGRLQSWYAVRMKPDAIRRVGDSELLILWPDGHRSLYALPFLRLNCRCAQCVDEITGQRLVRQESIPEDTRLLRIDPVGHYGVKMTWQDGHNTGIYSFDLLRALCPCRSCMSARLNNPAAFRV